MHILHAGNIANLGYFIARQLRKDGVAIDLVMEKNPPIEQDPIKYDPTLQNNYPSWILFYDKKKSFWKDLIRVMKNKKYDLIHAHYDFVIFAYLSMRPIISHVVGNDLREIAFVNSTRGLLLRKAYKSSKVVVFQTPSEPPLLEKLGIHNGIFVPFLTDVSFYTPQNIYQREFKEEFVIFHPTNLYWEKGNEVLVKGFAKFVKENPDSLLIIVNRGPDATKIHNLVTSLGIENKIKFIKGPLNSMELRQYYSLVDVVADQFIVPDIGSIGRETLCSEKPLLSFYDEQGYKNLYGESPPVVKASNPLEVTEQLEFLKDDKIRREIGKKGREWMIKYHSPSIVSKRIKTIYEGILNNEKVYQIREELSKISS